MSSKSWSSIIRTGAPSDRPRDRGSSFVALLPGPRGRDHDFRDRGGVDDGDLFTLDQNDHGPTARRDRDGFGVPDLVSLSARGADRERLEGTRPERTSELICLHPTSLLVGRSIHQSCVGCGSYSIRGTGGVVGGSNLGTDDSGYSLP